jgi:dCMP deaminase
MNRRVGCVIVDAENSSVLSLGYNGNAKGRDNNCEIVDSTRKDTISNCTCVHAEANALIKFNYSYPFPVVMYVTLSPCEMCAKMIVNAGISKVIYRDLYSKEILKILTEAGIETCQSTF